MHTTTRTVSTSLELKQLVADYLEFDEFVFDVETVASRKARTQPQPRLRRPEGSLFNRSAVKCKCCGRDFYPERTRKYCTDACRKAAQKDKPALDPLTNTVWCVSLAAPGRSDVIPCGHPDKRYPQLWKSEVFEALEPLFFSDRRKVNQNVGFDLLSIAKYYDDKIPPPPYGDTLILSFMHYENLPSYKLGELSKYYVGYTYAEKLGEQAYYATFQEAMRYSVIDAKMAWMLWRELHRKKKQATFWQRFEVEMQVLPVLLDMRMTGAYVDVPEFRRLLVDLNNQVREAEARIKARAAWPEMNVNSNAHLAQFLYDKLGLPSLIKTPTGKRATDAQTLQWLIKRTKNLEAIQAVAEIIQYKDLTKLLGTYVAGYFPHIEDDHRIRCSFNQAVAKTGRLSASQPNLQNIPARYKETFEATMVRRLFIAPPGRKLIVADYSQIELRILAHLTKDRRLLYAYNHDIDLHTQTAALVYGVPMHEVTKDQRMVGKTSNFNFAFGGGPRRVMEIANVSLPEAKKVYKAWHLAYPSVKIWGQDLKEHCAERGNEKGSYWVTTIFGRKRHIPGLKGSGEDDDDNWARGYAERQAINHPVQGTAAEIAKIALVQVAEAIAGYDAKLVLQVHDEFVIECAEDQTEAVVPLVRKAMEDIQHRGRPVLDVPLVADINIADNWAEGK